MNETKQNQKTPAPPSPAAVEPIQAVSIINELRSQAAKILGSVLTAPLVPFQLGALGNFPYYWQDPRNLTFNAKTYAWINTNLKANTVPTAQDQPFTNQYLQALSKITYSLSPADQGILNTAHRNATDQQTALLNAWKSAFGSIPVVEPPLQPVDEIMNTVTKWADPPTTLMEIQQATNLRELLFKTPASGQPVLPVLANYLNALGEAVPLENAVSMNNGYLARALKALQSPTTKNGGLTTNDGTVRPAFTVSTQLSDIMNGLKAPNAVKISMSVSRSSSSEFKVSISGGSAFTVPIVSFFSLGLGGNASYFSDTIATSSNSVEISMAFTGVTLVNFGPVAFDAPSNQYWYWMAPIREAIANLGSDVTGFRFSPDPNIDFGTSGPFGLLEGVGISNYPSVKIVVTSSDYQSIFNEMKTHSQARLSFLGIPLAVISSDTYSSNASVNASSQQVTITLDPPADLIAGNAVDSVGWILGVQTDYPAASN